MLPGAPGVMMSPAPAISVHVPVAGEIRPLPARVALVTGAHSSWSGPADTGGMFSSNTRTCTTSMLLPQAPLSIVQTKVLTPG